MQLVGRPSGEPSTDVDLRALQARGVRLAGRLSELTGTRARFRDDLGANAATADERMHRMLDGIDDYVLRTGLTAEAQPAHRPRPLELASPLLELDLARAGIGTVVVATGYRPDHHWVRLPIIDRNGHIRQYRGVTRAPGLYVVGQRFQHRRDSGFIGGARHDARAVVHHLLTGSLPDPSAGCPEEHAA